MTLTAPERPVTRTPREGTESMPPPRSLRVPAGARRFATAAWGMRRSLLLFIGSVAVLSAGVSLVLPKWYTTESTILPPAEGEQGLGLVSTLIENTALSKLGLVGGTTPSDIYEAILKSRTLREALVRDFDLERVYRQKGMDPTLKELDRHIKIDVAPVGVVTVRVEDQNARRAADMANHLVEDLDRFNRESMNTRAKRTREFLEKRLVEARATMAQAESTLTAYEKRNKIVASNEASAVGSMADVIAQKLGLEVRRSYMSSYSREGSAPLLQVDAEISAMDRELAKLPSLKQEGSRLALDAEIQRRVFTLLTAQYEDMRVQETRDTPTLTVLDVARVPEHRSRPRRGLIVVGSVALATLMGMAWVGLSLRGSLRA